MSDYRHILAAIELEPASQQVLAKAQSLARALNARLSVVHVLETLPVASATLGDLDTPMLPTVDMTEPLTLAARRQIEPWCAELGIDEEAVQIVFDAVKPGIPDYAERVAADLIIVGRHPHHGLSALFGHTEQGVLNRAQCDVLAVILPEH